MVDLAKFSQLVGAIYDADLDAARWAALTSQAAAVFDSPSFSLQLHSTRSIDPVLLGLSANFDAKASADYQARFFAHDMYVRHAFANGLDGAYLSQQAIAPADLVHTEFYTDWGRRIGVSHVLGGGALFGEDRVALLAVHRPLEARMFDEADRQCLALLLPHVGRALHIAGKLGGWQAGEQAKAAALERLQVGAVVVAADGAILWHNPPAERIFQQGDAMLATGGRLSSHRHADTLRRMILESAVPNPQAAPPGGVLTLPRPGRPALSLLVGPLDRAYPGAGGAAPSAIVFLHDPQGQPRPDEAVLTALYGLTIGEARLAAALVSGERLQDFAERHALALATVKSHLRQVLAKTGTARQVDMVALLLRNTVLRMADPAG